MECSLGKGKSMSQTYCIPLPLHEANSVAVFEFLTRILLSLRVMKLHPSHLNARPCALMPRRMRNTRQPRLANQRLALWQRGLSYGQFSKTAPRPVRHDFTLCANGRPRPVRRSFRRAFLAGD